MKQIEFHYTLLKGISIDIRSTGRGYGYEGAQNVLFGQETFQIIYDDLSNIYLNINGTYTDDFKRILEQESVKKLIAKKGQLEGLIYASFTILYNHNEYGSKFGNYYKNLYYLIRYIDKLSKKKEYNEESGKIEYYIDLIKAQLSKYELLLLAYDCIWIQDKPKGENFIDYASKYALLSALETENLIVPDIHKKLLEEKYNIKFRRVNELSL